MLPRGRTTATVIACCCCCYYLGALQMRNKYRIDIYICCCFYFFPHCCWWCFCGHSYNIYRCRWRCWRTSNCVMMNKCSTMADTVHHARRQMEERMLHLSFIFVCVGEKITIFYRMSGHKNIPFSFEYTCMQVMCGGYAGILAYFHIRFHSFDGNTLMWCVCVCIDYVYKFVYI